MKDFGVSPPDRVGWEPEVAGLAPKPPRNALRRLLLAGAGSDTEGLQDILAGILNIASEGIVMTDERMRILLFSRGAEAIFGYSAEELLGQPLERLIPEDFRLRHRRHMAEFAGAEEFSRRMSGRGAVLGRRKSGEPVPLEVGLSKLTTASGVIFTAILRDVSGQLEAQEALAKAARQAEAANRAKSEFLAVMSHEIRTPLNGVLAVAEVIQRRLRQEDLRPFVGTILNSGQTLLRLLSDALDLSRAEAGRLVLQTEAFSLAALVDDIETLWRPRANEVGVTFSTLFDGEEDLWVVGDMVRLKQVLNNLVGNALKFTKDGRVDVRLSARRAGDLVALRGEVEDTGPGIDPAQADRLFTPFGQTEAGRRAGGAGLGLSICRQLVEKMGGEIGLESRLGEGSRFSFEVALTREAHEASQAPAAPEAPAPVLGAPHVLVVDDNATNRLVAETLLEMMGCTFASVENGAEAVDRVRAEAFDLVLMDVTMPVMDGLEATRRIRAMATPAGAAPIIALTANADPLDAESYLRAGMDAVVEKPIKPDHLLATMSAVLEAAERSAA